MNQMMNVISKGAYETLYMVFFSTVVAVVLGFIPAVILTLTAEDGLKPNKVIYGILDAIVNVFRSFPFLILMIIVTPLTRLIVGKSIGTTAAIVPLTIIFRVYVKESVPRLINGVVLLIINMIGASAMAGALGGGGLGDVAIRKGYQGYNTQYLVVTSLVLIVLVQLIQAVGNVLYRKKS